MGRFWLGGNAVNDEETEARKVVKSLAHSPKTHLEQYLQYYVGNEKPGYAVLVVGEWGTGKTHQVTKALPDTHAYYISLFGLNTTEEIEAQVFSKMFPRKAAVKKTADKVSSINAGVPGYGSVGLTGLVSVLANTFIKDTVDLSKPLIFDDLERCSVENHKILGIVNRYVEHHKCRVIVIAHDLKVVNEFKDSKEKIFGQTLMVEPDVEAAFKDFVDLFSKQYHTDLLGILKTEVLSTFKESGASSLRVLRHVVEDIMRLLNVLETRHRDNQVAMVEMIRLFSASAIEYRTNHLRKSDLMDRKASVYRHRILANRKEAKAETPAIVKSCEKYVSVDLTSTLLNDKVLVEMLVEGRFVQDDIRHSIDASAYFLKVDAAPPWQIVGNFDRLDDGAVEQAKRKMEEQFLNREVTESGEFLHIVSLKMMMASKGVIKETVPDVADAAKNYVDDLLKEGRLPPRLSGWMWAESFSDSYGGVQYWLGDAYTDAFREVFDYLIEARCKALEDSFPEHIPRLLDVVRTNGQKFFEMVCHTHDGKIEFEGIPILAYVDAVEFVDAWLDSPRTGWYWIANALKQRSKETREYPSLLSEGKWVALVATEMAARAKREQGLTQLRLTRATESLGIKPLVLNEENLMEKATV